MRCVIKFKLHREDHTSLFEFSGHDIDVYRVISEFTAFLRPELVYEYPRPKDPLASKSELVYERLKHAIDCISTDYGVQTWSYQVFV